MNPSDQTGPGLDNRFELLEQLGAGGFGVVYKARQLSTGQLVAIKILRTDRVRGGSDAVALAVARFEREMQVIGQLKHPNIVKLIDRGQLDSGELFIALEFVEGRSLDDVARSEGGLAPVEAIHLMTQVLEALAVAHASGIVHRDLKPHNVMVTSGGYRRSALVLDFGIAGIIEDARDETHVELTGDHAITGSPAYMSPEQITRAATSPRMDIYAWGLLFIETLTGQRAFAGDDAIPILMAQVSDDPVPIPARIHHPGLRRIIARATAKDPDARYQRVETILAELERIDPHEVVVEPSDPGAQTGRIGSDALAETASVPVDQTVVDALPGALVGVLGDTPAPALPAPVADAAAPAPTGSPTRTGRRAILAVVTLIALALSGLAVWWVIGVPSNDNDAAVTESAANEYDDPPRAPVELPADAIAVLPFANLSADADNEYFSDGLADELIQALSQVDALSVTPRTTSFGYKDTDKEVATIARELGVATVVEGSVRKAGDQIRIRASLVDGRTGKQLWSESFDRQMSDVFAVQEEIAQAIVGALRDELGIEAAPTDEELVEQGTTNTEAYNLYLRGRFYWNKRTPEAAHKAIAFLEQALELQPDYALAWAALADMVNIMAWFSWIEAGVGYPRAEEAALEALELDPQLGEVYASLAVARLYWHWDWEGCEAAYLEGHQRAPGFATGHQWYGSMFLVPLGRFDEAREHLAIARELDPISPIIQTDSGDVGYYSGDHDTAIGIFEQTIEMHPDFFMGHYSIGRAYVQKGLRDEAIGALETARRLSGDAAIVLASLGYAHGVFGEREAAERILAELDARAEQEYVQAAFYARVYAGMGDTDRAFEALDRAVEDHSAHVIYLKTDPAFAGLADDPRFDALLERVGVTAWEAAHPDLAAPRPDHPAPRVAE